MREWTDVCTLVRDDSFMRRFTYGHSRFMPLHIAFVFSGKVLVSAASNTTAFGHAERNCIRAMNPNGVKIHRRMKMIVVRLTTNRTFTMSRPCYHCCLLLKHRLPRARVYYTGEDGTLLEDICLDNTHVSLSRRPKICVSCSTQRDPS